MRNFLTIVWVRCVMKNYNFSRFFHTKQVVYGSLRDRFLDG